MFNLPLYLDLYLRALLDQTLRKEICNILEILLQKLNYNFLTNFKLWICKSYLAQQFVGSGFALWFGFFFVIGDFVRYPYKKACEVAVVNR